MYGYGPWNMYNMPYGGYNYPYGAAGNLGVGMGMGAVNPYLYGPTAPYVEIDTVLDDEDIEENVRDSIDLDPYIPRKDKNSISVSISGGVAKLSGTVSSRRSQFLAYADAFWSAGVIDVESELSAPEKEAKQAMPAPKRQ